VKKLRYSQTRWLWWLALIIAAVAATSIYFIRQDPLNLNPQQQINAIIIGSATLIGICIISATAQWWLKR
jgi:CHASE2 domain-containing sensor protein